MNRPTTTYTRGNGSLRTYTHTADCLCARCVAYWHAATREAVQHNLTTFFTAVSEYINQHILAPDDMIIRPVCGHPYFTKLAPDMSAEDIAFLKSGLCPECAENEAAFEEMCEAEYQEQQAARANIASFFQAVAIVASEEVDPLSLDWEGANLWRELQDAWELVGGRS